MHDVSHTLDAIVNVHNAVSLLAAASDFYFMFFTGFGFDHFSAHSRRGFHPPAVVTSADPSR